MSFKLEVAFLREEVLKVEGDGDVDNAVGIGDAAHQADHHLQNIHHQGGQCV